LCLAIKGPREIVVMWIDLKFCWLVGSLPSIRVVNVGDVVIDRLRRVLLANKRDDRRRT